MFLPIADRFLTWGGAAYTNGGPYLRVSETDPTKTRQVGPYLFNPAKADGSWTLLDAVEDLVVPDDLGAALDAVSPARAHFEAFPRSVRRSILEWIVQARRPETRARRVAETAERASRNERANQWRRPFATSRF